jgi:hypothetical protein
MLSEKLKFMPDPDVICSILDSGETVLLNSETGHYFSLNETGSLIWKWIGESLELDEISNKLVEKYEVSNEDALQSIYELVEDLLTEKLILPIIPG